MKNPLNKSILDDLLQTAIDCGRRVFAALILCSLALLPCAGATIGYFDGPSPIEYNATTLNAASFTVSPGASVLVVLVGTRNQGNSTNPGNPTNVKWNGNTLNLAIAANTTASTYDYNMIYYLMNPPAGSGSVTATFGTGVSQTWWMAYTLTNVSTTTAVLTGSAFSTSASSINNTVANVLVGDWAAVNTSGSANNSTLTLTAPNGGTVLTATDKLDGNATMTMGSVSNLIAGNNQFVSTDNQTAQKMVLCEAVFAPFVPAPAAPTLSAATALPVQVDLSWSASAGTANYILKRGVANGGPYTDYTNILNSTTTNFVDANVVGGTTYYYVIGAGNGAGTNFSAQQSATPPVGPPFAPILGGGAGGIRNVTLHWTPTFGATNYIVLRGTTSGGETQIATTTDTTYTDIRQTAGVTNYYTVEAQDSGGTSAASDEVAVVVLGSRWFLFDNFSLDTVNAPLNGQTGSAGLGTGWTNLGGGTPIFVANSPTFGGANYAQYTPGSPTSIGNYEAGLGIASNSTAATVFLEFSLPGIQSTFGNVTGSNVVAMNFDIDNSNPPGALTGASSNGPSAQFNYDNSTGFGFFRVANGNPLVYATISPTNTPYLAIPGNVYYFWFVINAAQGNYQIYLANGSETGTNVDAGGLGATPTLMWGTTTTNGTGSVFTFGFRNVTAGGAIGQPVNVIGTGPGSTLGTVPQNEFANIYVDQTTQNLTNPVTGAAPTGTPQVLLQPQSLDLYAGATAMFSIVGSAGVNYQWQSNGVPISNGGNFSGATSGTLVISNVTAANAANYSCVVVNPTTSSFASSTAAALTIVTPNGAYETADAAAGPLHFYAFDDTGDTSTGTALAFDYAGADNGIYGIATLNGFNGIAGPRPSDNLPGFSASNFALQTATQTNSHVAVNAPWNLNTNTVTITAWVNPSSAQDPLEGIVVNRGSGTDVEALNIGTNTSSLPSSLGYTWNGEPGTYNWDSGLQLPQNEWSFVALTVTPTNAVLDLMNTNGLFSVTHVYNHIVVPFSGTTYIGDDSLTANGTRAFIGSIDDVAVFGQALTQQQLQNMFAAASGISNLPPTNTIALVSPTPIYPGQSAVFSSVDGGSAPLTYIWQLNGANLTDGANAVGLISGSATPNLVISNLAPGDAGQSYSMTLVISNSISSYTSAPVTLNVSAPNSATSIHTTEFEAAGLDWDTAASWDDNLAASVSEFANPGSTYFIVPGTMERSPAVTNIAFPGNILVIQGNGVLQDGNGAAITNNNTTGELRLKQSGGTLATNFGTVYTQGGSVTFADLQLSGGQIDNGNPSVVALNGRIDVLTNSSIYSDSAAATSIRSYQINALLTGTGTLTYAFLGDPGYYSSNDIVVSNPSNTFSGQWNILEGALVGNASNSLGTNTISIAANAALETTYNLNIPNGVLFLNGQMYLYTADTVFGLVINNTNVAPGTYTWAQLNSAFPASFPSNWPVQLGSTTGTNTGPGSITVLATVRPVFTQQPTPASLSLYPGQTAQFSALAPNATSFQWWFTNASNIGVQLNNGSGISGATSNVLTISNVVPGSAGVYVVIATDAGGSTTSATASLTILSAGPAITINATEVEPQNTDWNTAASWDDNLAANVSEFANPGSTYNVPVGTLERTPATTNATFPGNVIVIQGNGVFVDGSSTNFTNTPTTGELRLKQSGTQLANNFGTIYTQGGTVTFLDLQLNGGQVDNGTSSAVDIEGQIDVLANSSIYADNAAAGSIRSIQIDALLTGTGTLTYTYNNATNFTNNDLIISHSGNTFSGQWNILQGALLGNAPNSLGTNSITIGTNAALETTYNLHSTNASLTLNGQMYLYTADTFNAVTINGTQISPGTYTWAQMNSAFPANFPSMWPVQLGSTTGTNTGSGSLTVLTGPPPSTRPPSIARPTLSGGNLTLTGTNGTPSGTYHVLASTNVSIHLSGWTVVTNGSFDASGNFSVTFPVTGNARQFFSVVQP